MKTKTALLFVAGLGVWLLLTNYQVVYSKLASLAQSSDPVSQEQSDNTQANIAVNDSENSAEEDNNNLVETASNNSELPETTSSESPQANEEASEVVENDSDISETDIVESNELKTEPTTNVNNEQVSVEVAASAVTSTSTESSQTTTSTTTTAAPAPLPAQSMWMPSMYGNTANAWMNPMYGMMLPMMSMMGTMMNPAMYMNPMTMMNYPMSTMTQPPNMNAMMGAMDPRLMFGMFGQPSAEYKEGKVPDQLPVVTIPGFPTQTYFNWPQNKVSPGVTREAKKNAFQTAMAVSPLSMRDMISIMADKIPVAEDVSWDDAVEAMKLRANEVNFKFVGSSPLWKQIEAETEQPSAKVEMFRFCDARVARKILDEVPEFIVFLPCKIALIEDGDGKLWVMTLDWDVAWLDYAQNPNNHLSKDIRESAQRIRDNIQYIMEGAATGDF